MKLEIRIVNPPKDVAVGKRQSVAVEIQSKRGETYNVQKSETMLIGPDPMIVDVPANGRLVFTAPDAQEEVVYDHDQSAAIRPSAQQQSDVSADRARTTDAEQHVSRRLPPETQQQMRDVNTATPPPQRTVQPGSRPTTQPASPQGTQRPLPTAAQAAESARTMQSAQGQPAQGQAPTTDTDAAQKAKQEAEARASQQSAASRPPGEKPPLPGSPVGSPPAGNEGKSN